METNEGQRSYYLKLIANEFNSLSEYDKYINTHKEYLEDIYNKCLDAARRGSYSTGIFTTFRYNDPNKENLVRYFINLGYKVDLFESGLIKGEKEKPSEEELKIAPYRQYILMINWE